MVDADLALVRRQNADPRREPTASVLGDVGDRPPSRPTRSGFWSRSARACCRSSRPACFRSSPATCRWCSGCRRPRSRAGDATHPGPTLAGRPRVHTRVHHRLHRPRRRRRRPRPSPARRINAVSTSPSGVLIVLLGLWLAGFGTPGGLPARAPLPSPAVAARASGPPRSWGWPSPSAGPPASARSWAASSGWPRHEPPCLGPRAPRGLFPGAGRAVPGHRAGLRPPDRRVGPGQAAPVLVDMVAGTPWSCSGCCCVTDELHWVLLDGGRPAQTWVGASVS